MSLKRNANSGFSFPGAASLEVIDKAVNGIPEKIIIDEVLFNDIYKNLSKIEKFVYQAVPIERPWRAAQIINEIRRSTTISYSLSLLEGTLSKLVGYGLIIETSNGVFIREIIHKPFSINELGDQVVNKGDMKTDKTKAQLHVDYLFNELYEDVCKVESNIKALKLGIRNAATVINEHFEESEEKLKQLVQLKALLKGISE